MINRKTDSSCCGSFVLLGALLVHEFYICLILNLVASSFVKFHFIATLK